MVSFTAQQVERIRRYIADNPDTSPADVGDHFGRVDGLDRVAATTLAGHILNGEDEAVAALMSADRDPDGSLRHRYANAVLGCAAGDAWGFQVEFHSYAEMTPRPVPPPGGTWVISDDTQMTLATHEALYDVEDPGDLPAVVDAFIGRYLAWSHDPDNDRAPGTTCMGALAAIESGLAWNDGGARSSAGCGAVMRQTPTAFTPRPLRRALCVLQGAVTHLHPKALLTSLLLCDAYSRAIDDRGGLLTQAVERLHDLERALPTEWAEDARLMSAMTLATGGEPGSYLQRALTGEVHRGTEHPSPTEIFTRALRQVEAVRDADVLDCDPCAAVGQGWDAVTATALALSVADVAAHRGDPVEALAWAATSNGDSDSIAAIGGALIGAADPTPGLWSRHGLEVRLEDRYAAAVAEACARGPAGHRMR